MGAILVTGGSGYIGSHVVMELLSSGRDVIVVDNLSHSKIQVLEKVNELSQKRVKFYPFSLQDSDKLREIFQENEIEIVIHLAGLKSNYDSLLYPELYHDNNVKGSESLLKVMDEFHVHKFVFMSSKSVYGEMKKESFKEEDELSPLTPYGQNKKEIEQLIWQYTSTHKDVSALIFRAFNVVGNHESGRLGESNEGMPSSIMTRLTNYGIGNDNHLFVYGNDYDTIDKTAIRDYIHILDVVDAFILGLHTLDSFKGVKTYNLGQGKGTSVLKLINSFSQVNNVTIDYEFHPRREGDVTAVVSDIRKIEKELGWKAKRTLSDACKDAWNWQKKNPYGYM